MIIAAEYSFNNGHSIQETHPHLLQEVIDIIAAVDALHYKTKVSEEITMPGKILYSPTDLNDAFAQGFESKGWQKKRIKCNYSTDYYRPGYLPKQMRPASRVPRDRLSKRTSWDRGAVWKVLIYGLQCVCKNDHFSQFGIY